MNFNDYIYNKFSINNKKIIDGFFENENQKERINLIEKFDNHYSNKFYPNLKEVELKDSFASFIFNEENEAYFRLKIDLYNEYKIIIDVYLDYTTYKAPVSLIISIVEKEYEENYNPDRNNRGGCYSYYIYSKQYKKFKVQVTKNELINSIFKNNSCDINNEDMLNNYFENINDTEKMLNEILLEKDINITESHVFNALYQHANINLSQ